MEKPVEPSDSCKAARERAEYSTLRYMAAIIQHKQFLDGVTDAAKLVTGPLVAVGASTLVAATMAANPALMLGAVALLVVSAVSLTAAIATSYMSSQITQKHSLNEATLQAKLSAKALVQEMKANNLCITNDTPSRSDGKSWVSATNSETQQLNQPCR